MDMVAEIVSENKKLKGTEGTSMVHLDIDELQSVLNIVREIEKKETGKKETDSCLNIWVGPHKRAAMYFEVVNADGVTTAAGCMTPHPSSIGAKGYARY
jgi:hypothetical protein